jgi:hypothetical protein
MEMQATQLGKNWGILANRFIEAMLNFSSPKTMYKSRPLQSSTLALDPPHYTFIWLPSS